MCVVHVFTYLKTSSVCRFFVPVFYDTQGDQALARVPLWPTSAPCLGCSWSQLRHSYSSTFQRRLAQRLSCWVGCVGHVDVCLFVSLSTSQLFYMCVNVVRGLGCLKHSSKIHSTFQWNKCRAFPLCVL